MNEERLKSEMGQGKLCKKLSSIKLCFSYGCVYVYCFFHNIFLFECVETDKCSNIQLVG